MRKIILSLFVVVVVLFLSLTTNFDTKAISIDDSSIFVKQPSDGDGTCVFTSCLNMFRRRAIIDGVNEWREITHSNYKSVITTNGVNVWYNITGVKGMNAGHVDISSKTASEKKTYFVSMLKDHPEGIVVYSSTHTVLLTDYAQTTDTFYCVETLSSYPDGRIKFNNSYIGNKGSLTQDATIKKITEIWYITNRSGGNIHTHSYSQTYEAIHPHKVFMVCSCGDYYYTGQVTVMTNCSQCTHTHAYKGAGYEAIHPHREYSRCSCGETKLTGNTGVEIEREAIHPHRKFYVCRVDSCSYNGTYTGEVGYTTEYEETYPYKEKIVCSVTSCSYNNTYTGKNALPRNVKITADTTTIETNKAIQFKFTVENANYWYFVVKKDGEAETIELATGKYNYSHTFEEEGIYTIELQAANDYGWSTSAFSITVTKPKKPTVKVVGDKVKINVGETINYNFTVENANYWYFVVKKDGEIVRNDLMTRKYECSHTFDRAGEYLVEIQAANDAGWSVYTVGATVVETETGKLTSSTVRYVDEVASVYTEFHNLLAIHKIVVAGYNNNRLVSISLLPADISKEYQNTTLIGKIDEVRVFVWDDSNNPICENEVLLLADFTTE